MEIFYNFNRTNDKQYYNKKLGCGTLAMNLVPFFEDGESVLCWGSLKEAVYLTAGSIFLEFDPVKSCTKVALSVTASANLTVLKIRDNPYPPQARKNHPYVLLLINTWWQGTGPMRDSGPTRDSSRPSEASAGPLGRWETAAGERKRQTHTPCRERVWL